MTQPPSSGLGSAANSAGMTQGVIDQAQDTVGQVVDQAQETAGHVAEQAKQQATSQLESQKERAVNTLVTVAQALRQTGQHLQGQQQQAVGGYVEQAAERVESMTNYLRTRDVPTLLTETQEFARHKPGLFLGGALALGFIGARFLMSSGQRAMTQRSGSSGYSGTAAYPALGALPLPRAPLAGGMPATPAPAGSGFPSPQAMSPDRASAQQQPGTPEQRSEWELGVTGALEP